MDNNDNRISQILGYLAKAASTAADGVSEVVQNASGKVGDKYDTFRLSIELGRMQAEQERLFYNLGRTLFLTKTGAFSKTDAEGKPVKGETAVDELMAQAKENQAQIDDAKEKMSEANGEVICPNCKKVCRTTDAFCAACGTKLGKEPAPKAEEKPKTEPSAETKTGTAAKPKPKSK